MGWGEGEVWKKGVGEAGVGLEWDLEGEEGELRRGGGRRELEVGCEWVEERRVKCGGVQFGCGEGRVGRAEGQRI